MSGRNHLKRIVAIDREIRGKKYPNTDSLAELLGVKCRFIYKVERTFAWMGNFRRLIVRWEHYLCLYSEFCFLALALLCLNRLLK